MHIWVTESGQENVYADINIGLQPYSIRFSFWDIDMATFL